MSRFDQHPDKNRATPASQHTYRWIETTPGRTVEIAGEEWLYFSGTSYLGIARDEVFCQLLAEGIGRYGSNYGGSRLATLQFSIFAEAEQVLAKLTGAPAALTVSSGTLAAQLVVQVLAEGAVLYYAPGIHPALAGPGEHSGLPFAEWAKFIVEKANDKPGKMVVLANAINALRVEEHDFGWIADMPRDGSCTLVLDDSHCLGVRGQNGGGTFSELDVPEGVHLVVVSSLGKAFGVPAGVILGSQSFIDKIKTTAFFGGASPAVPAHLYAFVEAQTRYTELRTRLFERIRQCRKSVEELGLFRCLDDYPVFFTERNELADFLAARKILVSSFRYPHADSELLTRVVINGAHRVEDVECLGTTVDEFFKLLY